MTTLESIKQRFTASGGVSFTPREIQFLEQEVSRTVEDIAAAQDFADAKALLWRLGELQEVLAAIWFRYDIPLSEQQKTLVRKFDRADDQELCQHVFAEIKAGRFFAP